jgi:hypothetical protein
VIRIAVPGAIRPAVKQLTLSIQSASLQYQGYKPQQGTIYCQGIQPYTLKLIVDS